ncbi:MAG: Ig-like domain-containing protein [Nocardioides sp.]
MAVDASKVLIGAPDQVGTGAILSAPLGTPLPANARVAIDAAFTGSGYVSQDGLALTPEYSTSDIIDWSGATVRRLLESFNGTITWSHIQWDVASLRNAFGAENVTVTPGTPTAGEQIAVRLGAHLPEPRSWVFKMKDGNQLIRIVVPNGQITTVDEMVFNKQNAIPLPVTLSCYPDAAGESIYIFTDDGVFAGSPIESIAITGPDAVADDALIQLTATATHANSTTSDVTAVATWASSVPGVATVAAGLVAAVAAGDTDITATVAGVTSPAHEVTVTA